MFFAKQKINPKVMCCYNILLFFWKLQKNMLYTMFEYFMKLTFHVINLLFLSVWIQHVKQKLVTLLRISRNGEEVRKCWHTFLTCANWLWRQKINNMLPSYFFYRRGYFFVLQRLCSYWINGKFVLLIQNVLGHIFLEAPYFH